MAYNEKYFKPGSFRFNLVLRATKSSPERESIGRQSTQIKKRPRNKVNWESESSNRWFSSSKPTWFGACNRYRHLLWGVRAKSNFRGRERGTSLLTYLISFTYLYALVIGSRFVIREIREWQFASLLKMQRRVALPRIRKVSVMLRCAGN